MRLQSNFVQVVKNLPAMQETWVWSLGWEDTLEDGMATHSSIPAWRTPMDRGAWWTTFHGVSKNETQLSSPHPGCNYVINQWDSRSAERKHLYFPAFPGPCVHAVWALWSCFRLVPDNHFHLIGTAAGPVSLGGSEWCRFYWTISGAVSLSVPWSCVLSLLGPSNKPVILFFISLNWGIINMKHYISSKYTR